MRFIAPEIRQPDIYNAADGHWYLALYGRNLTSLRSTFLNGVDLRAFAGPVFYDPVRLAKSVLMFASISETRSR